MFRKVFYLFSLKYLSNKPQVLSKSWFWGRVTPQDPKQIATIKDGIWYRVLWRGKSLHRSQVAYRSEASLCWATHRRGRTCKGLWGEVRLIFLIHHLRFSDSIYQFSPNRSLLMLGLAGIKTKMLLSRLCTKGTPLRRWPRRRGDSWERWPYCQGFSTRTSSRSTFAESCRFFHQGDDQEEEEVFNAFIENYACLFHSLSGPA